MRVLKHTYKHVLARQTRDQVCIGHVNKVIHAQIDSYLGSQAPLDYDDLNLDEQIFKIEPQLWNAICCLTRSKSEV